MNCIYHPIGYALFAATDTNTVLMAFRSAYLRNLCIFYFNHSKCFRHFLPQSSNHTPLITERLLLVLLNQCDSALPVSTF